MKMRSSLCVALAVVIGAASGCADDNCSKTLTCDVGDDDGGGAAGAGTATGTGGVQSSSSTAGGQGGATSTGVGGGQGGEAPAVPTSCQPDITCGGTSCCAQVSFPGGSFELGRSEDNGAPDYFPSGSANELPEHSATVAAFSLDRFEVTVGRFRQFVASYDGTPPPAGRGAVSGQPQTGWQSEWNAELPLTRAQLEQALDCNLVGSNTATWTDLPEGNESRPINCVHWYIAYAFCIWDGGRLPTEAEWEYAASGTSDRLYPWGVPAPAATRSSYDCFNENDGCDVTDVVDVFALPLGETPDGLANMAGNVSEWVRDHYTASFYNSGPCVNCVNLASVPQRVRRGGSFAGGSGDLRTTSRGGGSTAPYTAEDTGFRCARD